MKTPALRGILAMTASIAAGALAADYQTDTVKTKGGKEVVIAAIEYAGLRIQYDGLEIQVDPVAEHAPVPVPPFADAGQARRRTPRGKRD